MEWYLLAILTASVLGSLHCVGMCGPLALWASGAADAGNRRILAATAAYHLGRGICYVTVGLLVGWIGGLIDSGGNWLGIQSVAASLAGALMLAAGIYQLSRLAPVRRAASRILSMTMPGRTPGDEDRVHRSSRQLQTEIPTGSTSWSGVTLTAPITRAIASLRPTVFRLPLAARGLTVGLLTALLPCGWLYLFAVVALSSGTPWTGASIMLAFWVGTLPALVALVAGTRIIAQPLRTVAPTAVAILLIVSGATTMAGGGWASSDRLERVRQELTAPTGNGSPGEPAPCCATSEPIASGTCPHCKPQSPEQQVSEGSSTSTTGPSSAGSAPSTLWMQVRRLLGMPLPCCEQSDATAQSPQDSEAPSCCSPVAATNDQEH